MGRSKLNQKIAGAGVVVFGILFLAAPFVNAQDAAGRDYRESLKRHVVETIEAAGSFDADSLLPIYKVEEITRASVRDEAVELAQRLFPLFSDRVPKFEISEKEKYLIIRGPEDLRIRAYFPSGFLYFERTEKIYGGKDVGITKDRAVEVARKFLSDQDILTVPAGESLFVDRVRQVKSTGSSRSGESSRITIHNMVVIFGRSIDGIEVIGPGSRVVVFIGAGEQVVGLQKKWKKFAPAPVRRVAPLPIGRIADLFVADIVASFGGTEIRPEDFEIQMLYHGLFVQNRLHGQNYLQPAHTIGYRTRGPESSSARLFVYCGYDDPIEPLVYPPEDPAVAQK